MSNKFKAHTTYYNQADYPVPGVTTITGILNKPALVSWANKLGLQGIDVRKYVDDKADIGTLAHYLIECELKGETPDISDYSPKQVDQAENCLLSWYEWQKTNKIENPMVETKLVSEKYQYGGTCDIYCTLNGKPTLIDLKTGGGIYDEMFLQVSAYRQLLIEQDLKVKEVRIVRIGRNENEGFEDRKISKKKLELYFRIFLHCLQIYNLQKRLKEG